ncbi:uncharacterized protein LOC144102354 isoform X1 [Amblyomma americanum]
MASASRRSAQPTSLSYASAHASQQQPCRRPLPGILKTTPGFFSFPKGSPTTKTLRFQIPSPTPGSLAQLYAQEEAEQDLVLATGEAATRAKTEKSDSSSPPSAEETSYDKFHLRGHKRRRSPSPRRRSSSSASGADSVVPYWMPKEIQHYFLHYPDDGEEGRGAAGAPCTKEVPSALQCIGSEQPPRKDELAGWRRLASQPRSALATLCFIAALALIFVGTTTNVYVGMVHRARGDGRTPVVAGAGAGGADSAGAKKEPLGSKAVPRSMGDYPDALKRRRAETAEPTRRHAVAAFDSKEEREETTGGDAEIEGRSRHDEVGTDAGDDLPRPVTMDYMGTARDVAEIVHEFSSNEDDAHRSPAQMRASCGALMFSYCPSPRIEFYYNPVTNACVSTASDGAGVCIRGPNKFPSRQTCRQRCIEDGRPAKNCRHRAIFKECTRQDVSQSWWYHSSNRCHRWTFPRGRCPASGSDVFTTFGECWRHCVSDEQHSNSRAKFNELTGGWLLGQRRGPRPCRLPRTEVCRAESLKYAYFADSSPRSAAAGSRGLRCHSVPVANQLGHRCLEGANRFRTAKACRRTCVTNSGRH